MTNKIITFVIFVVYLLSLNKVYLITGDEESCVSYGPEGSHVYPVGSKSDGHQLQYTKAVSKFETKKKLTNQ